MEQQNQDESDDLEGLGAGMGDERGLEEGPTGDRPSEGRTLGRPPDDEPASTEDSESTAPVDDPFPSTSDLRELLEKHSLHAPGILMEFTPGRDSPLKGRLVLPEGELTPVQRSALLQDFARLIGWSDAGQARAVADVYGGFTMQREPQGPERSVRIGAAEARSMTVVETSAALSLTDGQAQRVVARSLRLAGPFAAVLDAQEEGHIGPRHADVIMDQSEGVPADSVEDYARRCLASARDRAGRLRTSVEVRRSAKGFRERAHPESASVRKQKAVLDRRVELHPEDDGMSTLAILLPEEVGLAAFTRIDREARALSKESGETRTLAQLRADVCAAAILGGEPDGCPPGARPNRRRRRSRSRGSVRADVTITVPLATLLGAADDGAVLGGMGVLDAATARDLAAAAPSWWIAFTDAEGTVVGMGRRRHRPPAALAAFIRARDVTCRWSGCSVPALSCEIDHLHEWASGGSTDPDNLVCLCARHHRLKTLGLLDATADTLGGLAPGRVALSTPSGQRLTGLPEQHETPVGERLQGRRPADAGGAEGDAGDPEGDAHDPGGDAHDPDRDARDPDGNGCPEGMGGIGLRNSRRGLRDRCSPRRPTRLARPNRLGPPHGRRNVVGSGHRPQDPSSPRACHSE
ncbi:HNH endonuclease signature motif containing protein [Sinomonas mesophila]|uniref:HNH endonuclease signature motif containing protein n=1 Tax=Sinomonas mesophila TaxID=1531955 RepID=UPI0009853240|nr:HNH endonuclease signature motif containing protein [Sinomonas mesophila]